MAEFLKDRGVDRFVDIYDNDGKYNQISWCADDELIYDHLFEWVASIEDDVPFFGFLLGEGFSTIGAGASSVKLKKRLVK